MSDRAKGSQHPSKSLKQSIQTTLKQVFGFDQLRPLQNEVILSVLQGHDSLAIMPTGSGKSLCYQLPALLFPGLTVVVSPLISLMDDQVMQLKELGIPAETLNSSVGFEAYQQIIQRLHTGQIKLLYAAPETLVQMETMNLLKDLTVSCFTIDEAHCISEWGHDFRPEYRQLREVRRQFPEAVCLSVTATATEQVRKDIKTTLGVKSANEFIASFDRKNLFLSIEPKTNTLTQTLAFLSKHVDESGIIYCATRKGVDELTQKLQQHGWNALPYHAGLDTAVRQNNQREFSRDNVPIIVATIAFGMGINKSNVRFILHTDLPKNIESYYQQIGRAGRDGLRADCLILYSYSDVNTINFFISQQAEFQQRVSRLKLDALLGFVETNLCRRRPLLNYFNEPYPSECGNMCDNCTESATDLVDITIQAQKFLSCVKRTGELFGVTHIIDVLRGSQAQKVLSKGHQNLSTYNIGADLSKKEWQYLARQFIQQGLMTQDVTYGSLKLTAKAYDVFKGQIVMGTVIEPTRQLAGDVPQHDLALFQRLRTHRKKLADQANVPPFAIFSDRTLVDMATYFPQSEQRFATMVGVGAYKLEKYAPEFLPIIQEFCLEKGIEEKRKGIASATMGRSGTSRQQEIVDLWNNGRSLSQIANQFQVKQKTVISHLWRALQAGENLMAQNLVQPIDLPQPVQTRIFTAFTEMGPSHLRPIYEALNETVSYDLLHIFRLHFVVNQKTPQ